MDNDILEKGYKTPKITEKTIENIKKYPRMYVGCPVRVCMGRIYTTKEFADMSDKVLSKGMPDGKKDTKTRILRKNKKVRRF